MSGGRREKIKGVVSQLEKVLGMKIQKIEYDPQIVGALGSSRHCREKAKGGNKP
jgi:activator of 2-hydroxyglutaryl-CoA dehydratase